MSVSTADMEILLDEWANQELATFIDFTVKVENLNNEMAHAYAWQYGIFKHAIIVIDTAVAKTPMLWRGVLWHEFCHVWDYFQTGSMGHYEKWIKRWISRPWHIIEMIIPFPIYLYNLTKR